MAQVVIELTFSNGGDEETDLVEVDVWPGTDDDIKEAIDAWIAEHDDGDYCWSCTSEEVVDWDDDYADPNDFQLDWDEYAAYCDLVDKHGEAYELRRADLINFDEQQFESSYQGCWDTFEKYVEHCLDDQYDIPDFLVGHIDMESVAREWKQDYSTYDGNDGTHIFRD